MWTFSQVFFKDFVYFLGTSIYLKEHLWVAASVHFNREASQRSTYLLEKNYSWEYLNVKIVHPKLFRGEYLFPGGRTFRKYFFLGSTY